jgi:hypothetical protein
MTGRPFRDLALEDVKRARYLMFEATEALHQAHVTLAHPDVPEAISITVGFRLEACQRQLQALNDAVAADQAMLQVPWLQTEGRS